MVSLCSIVLFPASFAVLLCYNFHMEDMFTLTPVVNTIELVPGTVYNGSITVGKPAESEGDFSYVVSVTGFNTSDDDVNLDLMTSSERTKIVDWITIENPEGTVSPNGKNVVNYTINVPADAAAGGQYATIVVSSKSDDTTESDFSIKHVYEIGSIIYARVNGELTHSGKILANEFPQYISSLPLSTTISCQNEGNVHETAVTTLTVRDIFTDQIVYPDEASGITPIEDVIMPDTSKQVLHQIDGTEQLGIYEVTQTVDYLGETSTETHTVLLCPLWLLGLMMMTIASLIAAIILMIRKHRRNKKKQQA